MRQILSEVDLHAVAMLVLLAPGCVAASLNWLWLGQLFLVVPLCYVLSKGLLSNPAVGRGSWLYLFVNVLLVLLISALIFAGAIYVRCFAG